MKKKIFIIVLSMILILSLIGCSNSNVEQNVTPSTNSVENVEKKDDVSNVSEPTSVIVDEKTSELPDNIETTTQEEPKSKYDTFTYYVTLPEKSDDISGTLEEKYNEHFAAHIGSYDDYDSFWYNVSTKCPFCGLDLAHFENHEPSMVCTEQYQTLPYDDMRLIVVGNTIVFEHILYENFDDFLVSGDFGNTTINPYWERFYQKNDYKDAISYFYNGLILIYYYTNIIPDNYTIVLKTHTKSDAWVLLSTNTSTVETLDCNIGIDYCSWWNENKDTYSGEKARVGNELFEYYSVQ